MSYSLPEQAIEIYQHHFHTAPLFVVQAPGRINLIGEHTDYNGGFVLPAAIDKAIYMAIGLSDNNTGTWVAPEFGSTQTDFNNIFPQPHTWHNYVAGVIHQYQKKGIQVPAFNCIVLSDIPTGAGMSSSAALTAATAITVNKLIEGSFTRMEMAFMCQMAEHEYAGVKCGIMDMFASLHGKKDHVIKLDCRSLEYDYFPLHIPGYQLVLFDSKVKHSLASGEYNVRRHQCEEGIEILRRYNKNIESLRDVSMQTLNDHKSEMPPIVYQRCFYVIDEISRTQQAAADLLKDDISAFGKKMFATHEGLSKQYEVSCAEIDILVDAVKCDKKVAGARMMGGGFGGCSINIVQEDYVDELFEKMDNMYFEKTGVRTIMYKVKASEGAAIMQ